VSKVNIGFLSYRQAHRTAMPPARLRALLAEAALQDVEFVLLNSAGFDGDNNLIQTDVWTPQGWEVDWRPLPEIVYIVGSPLNPEQKTLHECILRARPVIADEDMDKLFLGQTLAETSCEQYLIPSEQIPKKSPREKLIEFMRAHGSAVVKRVTGNQGIGLHFALSDGEKWCVRCDDKIFHGTLSEAADHLVARIAGRLSYRDYIVQRYVPSTAADGRPVDLRVHVQRRADGKWGVTRAYVRLAEVGMPLANTSRGGYQGPISGFLKQRKTRRAVDIEAEVYETAIKIAEIQNASHPLELSELGIDFLIDEQDQLWLIETNAFPQSSQHEHDRAVHAIGYAKSLALGAQ
jgi:hypothetical protein